MEDDWRLDTGELEGMKKEAALTIFRYYLGIFLEDLRTIGKDSQVTRCAGHLPTRCRWKHELHVNNVSIFSSQFTGNTLRLRYKHHPINAVGL
jgi:hypothetical protein